VTRAAGQLRAGDADAALSTCKAARNLNIARYECYVISASALKNQNKIDDAIGMLQLGLAVAPEDKQPALRASISELRGGGSASAAAKPAVLSSPTQAEIVLWKTIENSSNAADFRAYLGQYPSGAFVPLANARLQAFAAAEEAEKHRREEATRPWVDPITKLMWARQDNGSDINQTSAMAYCRNLSLAGFQDWRLPEIDELQQIYDPSVVSGSYSYDGKRYDTHLKGGIQMTGCCGWSATRGKSSGEAWAFYFGSGFPVLHRCGLLHLRTGAVCAPCRRMMGNLVI